MRLSDKRKSEFYNAIRESIMEIRLDMQRNRTRPPEFWDEELFKLEQKIWREAKAALNLRESE